MPLADVQTDSEANFYLVSGANLSNVTGSVAITTATLGVSGTQVTQLLTTGSAAIVALPSGTAFTYVSPITNCHSWIVSVSGINMYEVTGISGTNMASHIIYSGGVFAQDTTPSGKICIRVATATSGTVEMWAP